MSAEHCGKMQETPYCAYCGRRLWDNTMGINGLKMHVDSRVKAVRKDADTEERTRPNDICCERAKKSLAKWEAWQIALQELMDDASK